MIDQPYGFGSEAANLEYSSLSAILGANNYSPDNNFLSAETPPSSSVPYGQQFANTAWPAEPQQNISPQALVGGGHPMTPITYDSYNGVHDLQQNSQAPLHNGMPYLRNGQLVQRPFFAAPGNASLGPQQNGRELILPASGSPESSFTVPDVGFSQQSFTQTSPDVQTSPQIQFSAPPPASAPPVLNRVSKTISSTTSTPPSESPISTAPIGETTNPAPPPARQGELASDVYAKVTKSYSYIKSYQFLMSFLYKKYVRSH